MKIRFVVSAMIMTLFVVQNVNAQEANDNLLTDSKINSNTIALNSDELAFNNQDSGSEVILGNKTEMSLADKIENFCQTKERFLNVNHLKGKVENLVPDKEQTMVQQWMNGSYALVLSLTEIKIKWV